MALITDPDDLNQSTEVTINTATSRLTLNIAGNLSNDGVTGQALYSFEKEEWKTDATLIPYRFPQIAITPEQFEWVSDWELFNDTSRKLVRSAGFSEIDINGILKAVWTGIVTLGTFEDSATDNAYYQFGTDQTVDDTVNFDFNGPVDEAIKVFDEIGNPDTADYATTSTITRATGSFITDGFKVGGSVTTRASTTAGNDGTYVLTAVAATTLTVTGTPFAVEVDPLVQVAVDNRSSITLKIRVRDADPEGKVYDTAVLLDAGFSVVDNKVFRFPLGNATDLKIAETDANVDALSPYTQIVIKYLDATYNRDVDLIATPRDFGIIVDVGTHSGADGASATSITFTSADGGIPVSTYDAGTLTIHEGTDKGVHSVASTTATTVVLDTALTATEANLSYTLQRAAPITATAEEIYEKVQRELRKTTDIDDLSTTVIGRTAGDLLTFIGDTLRTGEGLPVNPNGGGSGVFIEGFDSNDTNRLEFTDNGGTLRTFPFVAAGTITFNTFLDDDLGPAEYWMFFEYTSRTNVTDFVLTDTTDVLTSAGTNLPTATALDYINISGLTGGDAAMNGIYQIDVVNTPGASWDVTRLDAVAIVTVAVTTANVDLDPINSPDAIIVQNNSAANIEGNVPGPSVAFDFDYDGNVQGGRTASLDANIILRAIGHELAQFVETTGTITQAVGQTFALVAARERNYSNP